MMSCLVQHIDPTPPSSKKRVLSGGNSALLPAHSALDHLAVKNSSSPRVTGITPIALPSDVVLPAYPTKCPHDSLPYIDPSLNRSPTSSLSGTIIPSAPGGREQSVEHLDGVEELETTQPLEHMMRRLASASYSYFVCGWGDGVTGAVLPYFARDYQLSYMTSSLIFVASTVGFGLGTLTLERLISVLGRFYIHANERSFVPALPLVSRFFHVTSSSRSRGSTGHSKSQARVLTLILSSVVHSSFFIIMGSRGGYPSLLLAYSLAALARAYLTSTLNAYASLTPKKPLGYLLGFWSAGAFASPLVCQTLIAKGVLWQNFYFGSLAVSTLNICFLAYAFRPTRKEFENDRRSALEFLDTVPSLSPNLRTAGANKNSSSSFTTVDAPSPVNTLKRTLSMPYQWVFSVFAWIHVGSETTTQAFIVTYLLVVRHANPRTAGYVTSGYWAGQAISRFIWGYYTPRLTFAERKHIIHVCIGQWFWVQLYNLSTRLLYRALACILVMHLLIWFVQSNVENAFSTAFIGFVSGPLFPATLRMANDVLPNDVHMVSMAVISAFASFGSALFPFLTGTISNLKGAHSLTYVTVAQTGVLFCLWCLFPSKKPSTTERI